MRRGKRDAEIFEKLGGTRANGAAEKREESAERDETRRDETRRDETRRTEVSRAWDRARPRESRRIAAKYCAGRSAVSGARDSTGEWVDEIQASGATRDKLSANLCACVPYLPRQRKRGKLSMRAERVDPRLSYRVVAQRISTRMLE
ncbi:hypothetical protein K0M31_018230 [Melipona bicolor]|uniref:Uncharacterized protein n=1 Tax=Melipona bicolor TaxID=60889 RepID=A0AA40FD18_9HYME|nr:hypothetical protein K0M31_018230 [Melipona bicolor]